VITLTPAEELFIAERLLSRVRYKSKKLAHAEEKSRHPDLLAHLRADIAECTRLATLLQMRNGADSAGAERGD
jgi:class 3 adenylate cyclase